jgi:hypothetical protein
MTRKGKRKVATAYHEAGHAVIARVLTLASGGATIKPDYVERTAGVHETFDPHVCWSAWEERGHVRAYLDVVWHARIMTYMAGAEANAAMGQPTDGDGDDRLQIAMMAEELCHSPPWDRLEPRLRRMTRMLLRRHWARVERVAKALLAKTTLTAKQLDKLVGRSVDDVKVNAPFLLEMARIRAAERRVSTRRRCAGPRRG